MGERNFDKKRCLDNIKFLVSKNPEIKMGELEAEAGVSAGYISRLRNKEDGPDPGMEFIVTAAQRLKVSIDDLVFSDVSSLSETEAYLMTFLKKMIADTGECKLEWEKETTECLNHLEADENGYVPHPLFVERRIMDRAEKAYVGKETRPVFLSRAFGDNTCINGDCYSLKMKNHSTLYLMDINETHVRNGNYKSSVIELWLDAPGGESRFLISDQSKDYLSELVGRLHHSVTQYMSHPRIERRIKDVLDAFMNDDLGENDTDDGLVYR